MAKNASVPISRVLLKMTIYLEVLLLILSSKQPECESDQPIAFLFALAPNGVYQAIMLPLCW